MEFGKLVVALGIVFMIIINTELKLYKITKFNIKKELHILTKKIKYTNTCIYVKSYVTKQLKVLHTKTNRVQKIYKQSQQ